MKNKKIKCDIYTRVSTTMQVDVCSLDAQKEKLKRYAEFQNMEIVNEYSDEGKSGKSVEGRPARCSKAASKPISKCIPVLLSPNAAALTSGGPSQKPVVDAAPPAA